MTEVEKSLIGKIAGKNKTSEAIFTLLALRDRNRRDINLKKLNYKLVNEGFKTVPEEIIGTFRELEKVGLGRLESVNGKTSTFRWFVSLKDVGMLGYRQDPRPYDVKPTIPRIEDKPRPPLSEMKPETKIEVKPLEVKEEPALVAPEAPKAAKVIPLIKQKGLTMEINNKVVQIHFPSDLSKQEILALSENWLQEAN